MFASSKVTGYEIKYFYDSDTEYEIYLVVEGGKIKCVKGELLHCTAINNNGKKELKYELSKEQRLYLNKIVMEHDGGSEIVDFHRIGEKMTFAVNWNVCREEFYVEGSYNSKTGKFEYTRKEIDDFETKRFERFIKDEYSGKL